ncbi:MAG: sorbosone dehydrogenase family protein [Spirochaetales bacterium]|nr:sorbosone dehydrogenase family protein [Spirochaetales bacterium]
MKKYLFFICIILSVYICGADPLPLNNIILPTGFKMEIFYYPVPGARSLAIGKNGTIFAGTRKNEIYAIVDSDNNFKGDELYTIAKGLNMPNGVAFFHDSLYVAEVHRIIRFDHIEDQLENPPAPVIINDAFPTDKHHGWKFIAFGPDNKIYIPVGAPCNVCEKKDKRYASITRMNPDGSGFEIFASGVRNTVGFDWHPLTGELWFTDNGRDMMGENIPPDELNRAWKSGLHFGFPYLHGKSYYDPDYTTVNRDITLPEIELGPHVAALGMRFYSGTMFPEEYKNRIFIAEHGSWNKIVPIGYRITIVQLKDNKAMSYNVFAEGWLKNGSSWGRPVDLLFLKDGSMLISDDKANVIYRIYYEGKR